MNSQFPRWYSAVVIGEDAERLKLRWRGVAGVAEEASYADIEPLVRLALAGRTSASPAEVSRLKGFFTAADPTFDNVQNAEELRVLAGAALAEIMGSGSELAPIAALACSTATAVGKRDFRGPVPLVQLANTSLAVTAEAGRTRPTLGAVLNTDVPKLDLEKAKTKVSEQPDAAGMSAAFTLAAEGLRSALKVILQRQANAFLSVQDYLKTQDEELDMLWWLTGQYSSDYNCAFDKVPVAAQALVFAKELADCTASPPGPTSVRAIMSRAGLRDNRKTTIADAVNAVSDEWARLVIGDSDVSSVTAPVHFAIGRHLETGDKESWIAGWAATTGLKSTDTISSLSLGESFYRERLLRAGSNAGQ